MDKLIVTVTVDSSMSYPSNSLGIKMGEIEKTVVEYVKSVERGASIAHIHGVHFLDDKIQSDGKKLSKIDFNGWQKMQTLIKEKTDALIQFGIASARFEEKVRLMDFSPEMMSINFAAHDEYFQPDPKFLPNEMYSIHTRDEILQYVQEAEKHKVKVEAECFNTGAFWNVEFVRRATGLLKPPAWVTLFLGWPGGSWTPPTPDALLYLVSHLPKGVNWNVSVMDPSSQWQILSLAIALGGHVRVGWEDNPYLPNGRAAHNWELVEHVVKIAKDLGRDIATPDEARDIIKL
jgi:3-keto-5-aminohexanoate cleavage enzyme